MTLVEMAKIIEAESSVLSLKGKYLVAQCIADNNYSPAPFTEPSGFYSEDSLRVAYLVRDQKIRPIKGFTIEQFRSGKYALPNGEFDWQKDTKHYLDGLTYLGRDINGSFMHFYFGKPIKDAVLKSPNYDFCGLGLATAQALEKMNIRDDSSTSGNIIGTISKNTKVEVLEIGRGIKGQTNDGWLKIVWGGSPLGYAYVSNVDDKYFKYI